jgi:hypothetical protein
MRSASSLRPSAAPISSKASTNDICPRMILSLWGFHAFRPPRRVRGALPKTKRERASRVALSRASRRDRRSYPAFMS